MVVIKQYHLKFKSFLEAVGKFPAVEDEEDSYVDRAKYHSKETKPINLAIFYCSFLGCSQKKLGDAILKKKENDEND